MRIASTLLFAVALIGLFAGCGGKDDNPRPLVGGIEYPVWVGNPFAEGQFGAVGISKGSLGGDPEKRARALARGRVELGRTISTKVQAAYKQWFKEGGEIFKEGQEIDENKMAMEMSENVSKQLTNQVITGSHSYRIWEHPENQNLYMWVIVDQEKLEVLQRQIKAQAAKEAQKRSFIKAEIKAEEAFNELETAIDRELAREQGMVAGDAPASDS
ncbi:MAG: hypothetical protein ACOCYP_04125 [Planctomycetota bacterium]